MSSPSPDLKSDQCPTCEDNKTEHHHPSHHHHHHHHVMNLNHPPTTTSHIHPIHVHSTASPKTEHVPKILPTCTCHLQDTENIDNDGTNNSNQNRKLDADDRIEVSPLPPALPPRPPPRQRYDGGHGSINTRFRSELDNPNSGGIRKYVFWCCACGGLATILGALFLAVYFILRSFTSTLGYFETIPTFVPATMLILTGLCVMSLARRKNRYSYLLKVCGLCCLVCALTCVLVTITTTVIHMNRLQTLRECVYTQKTRTCTCYSVLLENHPNADDGMRFVFDSTPDCEVIHGALYSCLRAMFGLSVSGILVCIFSCMLVYQLLSHEKKKMYWEQLELRCRSFYQQHASGTTSAPGSIRGPPAPTPTYCSCCEECRYPSIPSGPQVYPWDNHLPPDRFWAPGRIGNFYSPNPGEDPIGTPDNISRPPTTGWNWRRLPWSRVPADNDVQRDNSLTYQGMAGNADSQYGFSNRSNADAFQAPGSTGSYSVLDNRPPIGGVYVWGPPPPYSNPNSPARRPIQSPHHRYHHAHHHHESHCQMSESNQFRSSRRIRASNKDNYENTTETEVHQSNDNSESTDTSSSGVVSHTLPVRKIKKRTDIASVKSINQTNRTNVQNVFEANEAKQETEHETKTECRFLPRLQGVENAAFQKQESGQNKPEATESEVYFADVSSCCNISVKNDGQDSSLYDEALETQKPRLLSLQKNSDSGDHKQLLQNFQETISSVTEDEDYLAHRMANRQMSTRSRMPFPLPEEGTTCLQLPKELSQNSLCSSVQTPMTETTDDAITPEECCSYFPNKSNKQQQVFLDQFLAPDAQYEVIKDKPSCNLTNTISGLNNYEQNYYKQSGYNYNGGTKCVVPKTLNLQAGRRHIGSNISTLIQNLGGNAAGLLYDDANVEDERQGQGCHSDGTMDSGWQSGSDKKLENCADSA